MFFKKYELRQHLKLMHDYFLFGDGIFLSRFMDSVITVAGDAFVANVAWPVSLGDLTSILKDLLFMDNPKNHRYFQDRFIFTGDLFCQRGKSKGKKNNTIFLILSIDFF